MKEKKKVNLYYLASFLFYTSAIITFVVSHEMKTMGFMYLCLGSTMLCLGASTDKKAKEQEEKDDK